VPRTVCRPVVATVPVVVTADGRRYCFGSVITRLPADVERSLRPSRIGGGVDGGDQRAHSISGAGGVSEALATRGDGQAAAGDRLRQARSRYGGADFLVVLGAVAVWFAAV